jgi:hypothetical protein
MLAVKSIIGDETKSENPAKASQRGQRPVESKTSTWLAKSSKGLTPPLDASSSHSGDNRQILVGVEPRGSSKPRFNGHTGADSDATKKEEGAVIQPLLAPASHRRKIWHDAACGLDGNDILVSVSIR